MLAERVAVRMRLPRDGVREPGKADAAIAKLSQRGTSNADKAEPNQYEQAACRRD